VLSLQVNKTDANDALERFAHQFER
jgi:hypothetical protein